MTGLDSDPQAKVEYDIYQLNQIVDGFLESLDEKSIDVIARELDEIAEVSARLTNIVVYLRAYKRIAA